MSPLDSIALGPVLWKTLRELRRESLKRGLLEATGVITAFSVLLAGSLAMLSADEPSPALLETLAQVGAALLIAYVIEVSWLVKASQGRPLKERENRLGAVLGIGVAVLIAIAVALILAAQLDHGHWSWLDRLCLGFVIGPLSMAGVFVALQPLLTHEWLDEGGARDSGSDG